MTDYLISESKDIALVTLNNIPNQIRYISDIFNMVADHKINVDMISQTAPMKDTINISFSIPEADIDTLFAILKDLKALIPQLSMGIAGSNSKIVIYNKNMKNEYGIAAKIFNILKEANINLNLVTTAEEEISILVDNTDFKVVIEKLKKII